MLSLHTNLSAMDAEHIYGFIDTAFPHVPVAVVSLIPDLHMTVERMLEILPSNLTDYVIIIDYSYEGSGAEYIEKYLDALYSASAKHIIMVTGSHSTSTSKVTIVTDEFSFYADFNDARYSNTIPDKHFVSLARNLSPHRLLATRLLIDASVDNYGVISYATAAGIRLSDLNLEYDECVSYFGFYVEPILHPIYIDGPIDYQFSLLRGQRNIYYPSIRKVFFNLIHETNFADEQDIFITEKTTKAFAIGHVPIWNAVKGTADYIESLGFDIFRDVVDHSYDRLDTWQDRTQAVINELQKLCNAYTLAELQEFKKKNKKRFKHNFDLTKHYAQQRESILTNKIQQALAALDK